MTAHLLDSVAANATTRPDEPSVVTVGEQAVRTLSWRELWAYSGQIAALLLELGVRPGEPVAYQLPNCAEFVAITLAIIRIGAVCCPLMPIYRERELVWILQRAGARVLFVRDEYHGRRPVQEIAALLPRLPKLRALLVVGTDHDPCALPEAAQLTSDWLERRLANGVRELPELPRPSPSSLAQLLFTSGTTGEPKGVLHREEVLSRAAALAVTRLQLTHRDRIYVPSPLAHQTGFLYGMWLALALGSTQVLQERWNAERALWAMRQYRVTFVQAATPFLMDLVQTVEAGVNAPQALRIFVATGAAVPRTLARRAAETLSSAVCGAFGTTEGCLATLSSPADTAENAWSTDGRALESVQIRVCDDEGHTLPAETEGHLQVHSPTMFDGYLEAAQATADAYTTDGWYRTGDLARIDRAGYLHVTGRVKDVINRGGEKIPVADLEQLLYQHDAVREAAIVAMPDARLGERACAFVATRTGSAFDFDTLRSFFDAHKVAKPYWPERLEILDTLPKTASGKIQKFILRERARNLSPSQRAEPT